MLHHHKIHSLTSHTFLHLHLHISRLLWSHLFLHLHRWSHLFLHLHRPLHRPQVHSEVWVGLFWWLVSLQRSLWVTAAESAIVESKQLKKSLLMKMIWHRWMKYDYTIGICIFHTHVFLTRHYHVIFHVLYLYCSSTIIYYLDGFSNHLFIYL